MCRASLFADLSPLLLPSVLWVWTIVAGVTNALVPVGAGATFSLAVAMIGMWLFHEVLRTFSVAEDLVNAKLRRAKRKARSSSHRPGMDSIRQASEDARLVFLAGEAARCVGVRRSRSDTNISLMRV